jgi:hypothetical protein
MDRTDQRSEFSPCQSPTRNRKILDWQSGYGVVSFGTRDLEWVVNYIRNQKEHHKRATTVERLEKMNHDEEDES